MDDFLATEIGQVGTQFDGLGHIGVGVDGSALFYNGVASNDLVGGYGLNKNGVEHVKPIFTRGIVLDIAALHDEPMQAGDVISVEDIETALEKQGIDAPLPGDVVLFHTGWSRHWIEDNDTFNSGCPGIGLEAAAWLIDKQVTLVGADTWPVEVVPNPDPNLAFPVHQELLTKNGIFLHKNIATERLIEAGVSEFAYIFSPMPVKGATGSPGAPLAVQNIALSADQLHSDRLLAMLNLQASKAGRWMTLIRHPPSAIRHPPSAIRHPPSAKSDAWSNQRLAKNILHITVLENLKKNVINGTESIQD